MDKQAILLKAERLMELHKKGALGGEVMPEDANPKLPRNSPENYMYFTLPMALNYQRNSYKLWEGALATYNDPETQFVLSPKQCLESSFEEVQEALTKYKVALQRQKQTEIWLKLCETLQNRFDCDVRLLFDECGSDIECIRNYIQAEHKKEFPYLSGTKICNYWLYVMYQYTDREFSSVDALTVAPDTHVCKASLRLGLISEEEYSSPSVQSIVIERWRELFEGTQHKPIDIHTPLWLWSRGGFVELY